MSQNYTVTLRLDKDDDGDFDKSNETRELVTEADRHIDQLSVVREHTALSDFEIPARLSDYSTVESDWIGPTTDVLIEVNGDLIFRGYASRIEGNEETGEAILGGPDIFAKLRRNNKVDYKPVDETDPDDNYPKAVDSAINYFWGTTAFSPNVTFINASSVATDAHYDVTGDNDGFVDTADEWANNTNKFKESNAPDTDAIYVNPGNNDLTMYQHSWSREAEDANQISGTVISTNADAINGDISEFSGGEGVNLEADNSQSIRVGPITPDYTIPRGNFDLAIRSAEQGTPLVNVFLEKDINGDIKDIAEAVPGIAPDFTTSLSWSKLSNSPDAELFGGVELEKNEDYYISIGPEGTGTEVDIDAVQPHDNRFDYTYDNDNGGSGGYLDTPGLYTTDGVSVTLSEYQTPTPANITEATFDTITWTNGGGNGAKVEVSNDGGRNFNTASPSYNFVPDDGTTLTPRVTIAGQGTKGNPSSMPVEGINAGGIETIELVYDGNDKPVIQDETFSGSDFDIIKALHDKGGMRFVADYDKNDLKVSSFPKGETNTASYTVKNRERVLDTDGYANAVKVAGRTVDGSTTTATVENSGAISNKNERIEWFIKDPNITDVADAATRARQELDERLRKDKLSGTVEIVASSVQPGYRYSVTNFSNDLDLERVEYRERGGEAEGVLEFQVSPKLEEKTTSNTGSIGGVRRSL